MKNKRIRGLGLGLVLAAGLLAPRAAYPLESIYVGAQAGFVGTLSSTAVSTVGFAADIGFRTNPMMVLAVRSQLAPHTDSILTTANASVWANTLSVDLLVGNIYDIEIFVGGGPGFYLFNTTRAAKFGVHGELFGDLVVSDALRIGMGARLHGVFENSVDEFSFYSVMMRIGFDIPAGK